MPFEFRRLKVPDVVLVDATQHKDDRGYFMETYKRSEFVANGVTDEFVQDNCSQSVRGTLRGLHYQKHPHAQGKLIMVLKGEIFDVVVDIRRGSPTYAQWVGATLSDQTPQLLYVPVGFAHGFCVLSEAAVVLYKTSDEYAPESDRGIRWDDPRIGIAWPCNDPIISTKDAQLPLLSEAEIDFE
jgi:dTDP-4-dehydrorhamnose 3,5-epimerase